MAGSVNKVILIGNLGADPEVKTLTSGTKVARIRIATSETYTNREGEKITNTEWHTVNLWRGLADVAERYLKKGNPVYIEGKLKTRSYDDQDGNTKYITEIEADNMTMLGSANSGGSGDSAPAKPEPRRERPAKVEEPDQTSSGDDEDDLPF